MSDSSHIKLHIPGESFWATKLTEDTAQVDNILLNCDIGFKDIVKFNPKNNKVTSILIKKTHTLGINYSIDGDVKEAYKKVYNHFEGRGIPIEGMVAGMALISIPVELAENVVDDIIKECPVKVELMFEER